jgi:signal transduction histidine kinase
MAHGPLPPGRLVAYRDGVGRVRDALRIRPADVGAAAIVAVVVELNVATGGGAGAHPLNPLAYVLGAILVIPVLWRSRWPLQVLIACSVLLFLYYSAGFRRNISPAPLLSLPLYDAALAGYLALAIVIPAVYMVIGLFVVGASSHPGLVQLANDFLPSVVVLALAIMLGEVVRSRRALAAETADRLRIAAEEREAEAARRVAEERLRIARELHDTVAHSMATIAVQAGSALHVLGDGRDPTAGSGPGSGPLVRDALIAIRDTSKSALTDMRTTLGQLRGSGTDVDAAGIAAGGLDRLDALTGAVRAAGAAVSITVNGERGPLPADVDHAAYRILQESLTNVLRHAGQDAKADVCLTYQPGALVIRVTDDGTGPAAGGGPGAAATAWPAFSGGHGLHGMSERVAAIGGELSAGPRDGGGFEVEARLPIPPPGAAGPAGPAGPAASGRPATSAGPPATAGPAGSGKSSAPASPAPAGQAE